MNVVEFTIKQGDTNPDIAAVLRDAANNTVDLSGRSVQFRMRSFLTGALEVDAPAVPDPDQVGNKGKVQYNWQAADTSESGYYFAEWDVDTISQTFPTKGWHLISIEPALDSASLTDADFVLVRRLRSMIAESSQDTYPDSLLHAMLLRNDRFLEVTAAEVWREKMSEYAEIVDTSEGGSSRKLSQLYDRAKTQSEYYESISGGGAGDLSSGTVVRPIVRDFG